MFFLISKILSFLFNPLLWIFFPILICFKIKNRRTEKILYTVSIVFALVFTNSFLTEEVTRLWEAKPVADSTITQKYDYAIVLGGGMVNFDKQNNKLIFTQSTDRFLQAIHLFAKGKVDKILISGGNPSILNVGLLPESDLIKQFIVERCIPDSCVISENTSKNTRENAINSKIIINKQSPNPKILLLTSAYHIRRAKKCFEKVGLEVTAYPCDQISGPRHFEPEHLFIPKAQNLEIWERLIHEWVGYITYKFSGYI